MRLWSRCWAPEISLHSLPLRTRRVGAVLTPPAARLLIAGVAIWALAPCVPADVPVESDTALCPQSGIAVHPGVEGPERRCALWMRLIDRGLVLSSETGIQVQRELARPYATVLNLTGQASLPAAALEFLMEELPDTARMINFYKKSRYVVAYLDDGRSRFFATNNRSMQATFRQFQKLKIGGASDYLLFESGEASLLFWRFKGSAIIEFSLAPRGLKSHYDITVHIFTHSQGFHSFFESGLFRYIVGFMARGIIGDMTGAAKKLAASKDEFPTQSPAFIEDLRFLLR